jgi:hypothetical protein
VEWIAKDAAESVCVKGGSSILRLKSGREVETYLDVTSLLKFFDLQQIDQSRARAGVKRESYSKDFLEVWDVWPKKVGKAEAYREWDSLKKAMQLPTGLVNVVDVFKKYHPNWKNDYPKYVPELKNFLINKRWEDKIEPVPSTKPSRKRLE